MLKPLVGVAALLLVLAGCSDSGAQPTAAPGQPTQTPSVEPRSSDRWKPAQGAAWQWQLTGTLDLSVDVPVYDVDYEKTSAEQVAALQQKGRRVICYVSAGSYENFRPDQAQFPAAVLGKALDGWPDERWLDIRQWDQLKPLLAARFDQCRAKGFDAVEPDNVDGYANDTGFPLSADDQLTFNRRIAALAHERGMSVGLKNDLDQVEQLQPAFDFAVNEECMRYDECEQLKPFLQADKAVLHVEYDVAPDEFCAKARELRMSSMRKPLDLGPDRQPC